MAMSSFLGCSYKKEVRIQPWEHSYTIALQGAGETPASQPM